MSQTAAETILEFWFGSLDSVRALDPAKAKRWFQKSEAFDQEIRRRFLSQVEAAEAKELDAWIDTPRRHLAWILLSDQFRRNLYRQDPRAFAMDERVQETVRQAIRRDHDQALPWIGRVFFYLPLEHSESLPDQELSVQLFRKLAREVDEELRPRFEGFTDYAVRHRDVIERFGRFPHRNQSLGRESSPEEDAFLKLPGSRF